VPFSRLPILLLVLPLALLAACNRGARPAQLNQRAPDFTVSDGSTTVHLASYRGHPVLLNFWASWCGPCIEELPSLLQLHRDMPNLVILAVSIDDDPAAYSSFIARHHVDLITVRDANESAPKLFHTDMWPETYAINQQGYIERKFVGAQDWSDPEIRAFLKNL
jgi:cytochrome c biogenesis protein CcmG, thiol:disulfide interchange protein DsbE